MLAAVPSHPWTTLLRGFAPGPELVRHLARRLALRRGARLLRRRWATPLVAKRLGRTRRRRAADVGYVAVGAVAGERILLIDDVMTTGSTLYACARALKAAGAAEVRAAVWARTLPGAPRRGRPAVVCPQRFDYSWPLDGQKD
jgi:predicted amidophosphoribosyltransferase